tara:strand:+ start:513 stop:1016 length:504 start_codon:yes stop_codon:yes gene_type:complete
VQAPEKAAVVRVGDRTHVETIKQSIDCTCLEDKPNNCWNIDNCKVTVTYRISINFDQQHYDANGDPRPTSIPWRELLGHEQAHIVDRNRIIEEVLEPMIEEAAGGPYESSQNCDRLARFLESAWELWLNSFYKDKKKYPSHDNDPTTPRPPNDTGVPPVPNTPRDPF